MKPPATKRRGLSVAKSRCVAFGAAVVLASECVAADRPPDAVASAAPTAARQRELVQLLRQDCGSCHGMRLTGGLGPPLTAEALRDKPAESLTATIIGGRMGTAMPPWRPFMSEREAAWLVDRLRHGEAHAR